MAAKGDLTGIRYLYMNIVDRTPGLVVKDESFNNGSTDGVMQSAPRNKDAGQT